MKKIDKILIALFSIYLLGLIIYLIISYFVLSTKYESERVEIREIINEEETFIPYENQTLTNLENINQKYLSNINKTNNYLLEYNEKVTKSEERLRSTYFDFYSKNKTPISYLDFLSDNNIPLTNFEKKALFLQNNEIDEKIENGIQKQSEVGIELTDNTTLGNNKKIVIDKNNDSIRIQLKEDAEWRNIYFGNITFNNIENEYVYKASIIDFDKDEKLIYGIIYSINQEGKLNQHFIEIQQNENVISNIRNIYTSNIIYNSMELYDCNLQYRYLYVNIEQDTLNLLCRDSVTGTFHNVDILEDNE